jgi:outer membrane protein assembly factor BamD (BamD/ComL family)
MTSALLVLVLGAAALQDWQYVQGKGYVDRGTGELSTPEQMFERAAAQREAGRHEAARAVYAVLAYSAPHPLEREKAQWELAETRFRAGEFEEAYFAFREFVNRFPQSPQAPEAKRREMESALDMAKNGSKVSTLGLRLFTSTSPGVDALRESLRRYPRESFSADFTQKLGMVFYRRGEWDAAAGEFQLVLDHYPGSPESVLALYMSGVTWEQRFDDIERDEKPLKEARRIFERFLEEADRLRRLDDPAPRWVDELVPATRQRLRRVYGLLHEKTLRTADYYHSKDYFLSALIYYRILLRDEALFRRVISDGPELPSVARARARVAELSK